jgi:peptidoglycan-associated lipoprotein
MWRSEASHWVKIVVVCIVFGLTMACAGNPPPVEPEPPQPPPEENQTSSPSVPAPPPPSPPPPSAPTIEEEGQITTRSLEELNRESPLEPVFFDYDSSELTPRGQTILQVNADLLSEYSTWVVTIEGHCDQRGSPEYNLGLGERRALVAEEYLIALGVDSARINTVSYGKEFPFAPDDTEEAHARNRRAHFVITGR